MTSNNKESNDMLNKIFADFNNADEKGRVRLNTKGTLDDLKNKKIELNEGIEVLLDDDDGLVASGVIRFSEEESICVALIDWNKLKSHGNESDKYRLDKYTNYAIGSWTGNICIV